MTNYKRLKVNPPAITIATDPREVIIKTVSCMCDNIGHLTLKKNADGDFKVSGNGFALSNWQMKREDYKTDIEWAADEHDWREVFSIINSGTAVVASARSR